MNIVNGQWFRPFRSATHLYHFYTLRRPVGYKSAYSLDNLYPTSTLKLYTPNLVPENPAAKFNGYIPINKLDITYSRSSGAGGQHVNRTNSKVNVRFNVKEATWLCEEIKEKLLMEHKNKITKDGSLIIKSEITKSQQLNLADALQKLRSIIWELAKPPPEISPETEELKRKQMQRAARKRLFEKRRASQIKQFRTNLNF